MAIVPTRDNFRVLPNTFSAGFGQLANPIDKYGPMRNIADTIGAYGYWNDRNAQTEAIEASNEFQVKLDELTYGQTGYLNRKGKDAQYLDDDRQTPVFDHYKDLVMQAKNEIGAKYTGRSKEYFDKHAMNAITSFNRGLVRHQTEQHNQWTMNTLNAGISSDMRQIVLSFMNDKNNADLTTNNMLKKVDEIANLQGLSEVSRQEMRSKYLGEMYASCVSEAITEEQHELAKQLLERAAPHMSPDEYNKLSNVAMRARASFNGSNQGNNFAQQIMDGLNPTRHNALVSAFSLHESNNEDYDKDGSPLVGRDENGVRNPEKYGHFAMQVTKETAFDKSLISKGITPAREYSAKEFNRVGRELINYYDRRFNGNLGLMAIAYNAGEGRAVDIEKAMIKDGYDPNNESMHDMVLNQKYKDMLPRPKQTVPYMEKIISTGRDNLKKVTNGRVYATERNLQDMASQLPEPKTPEEKLTREIALSTAKKAIDNMKELDKADDQQLIDSAINQLIQNNHDYYKIAPDLLQKLEERQPEMAKKLRERSAAFKDKSNAYDDEETVAQMDDDDYLVGMSKEQWTTAQYMLTKPTYDKYKNRLRTLNKQAGKGRGNLTKDMKDSFEAYYNRTFSSDSNFAKNHSPKEMAEHKKMLRDIYRNNMFYAVDRMDNVNRKNIDLETKSFFEQTFMFDSSFMGVGGLEFKHGVTLDVDDIPKDSLREIKTIFAERGVDEPTNMQILHLFLSKNFHETRNTIVLKDSKGNKIRDKDGKLMAGVRTEEQRNEWKTY